jgi:hypothetical protein
MSKARSSNGKIEVKISPVCNKCRERHLKCDGGPQCSRCRQEGVPCHFRPSRRGMRPSNRRKSTPASDDGTSDVVVPAQTWVRSQRPTLAATDASGTLPCLYPVSRSQSGSPSLLSIPIDISNYLTDLFYAKFYPDHQFVLPREQLVKELAAVEHCPLQPVIEYIGTFYDATFDRSGYQHRAEQLLSAQRYPSDGSLVQALLVLAIGLHAEGYAQRTGILLQRAKKCAITIGMHEAGFASLGPGGQIVQVESWRRTWLTLKDLCQSCQPSPNISENTPDLSRSTPYEINAPLEATTHYQTPSTLTTSMAWKGFGASPFTMGRAFQSQSNFNTRHDGRHPEDDSTRAIDELLSEAGIYDSVESHNVGKHSTGWKDHRDSHGTLQDNRLALVENDFTRMLF